MALSPNKSNHKIAIFASGTGSNAKKIIEYFQDHSTIQVSLVVSNKPKAGVLKIAEEFGIPTLVINRHSFYETRSILEVLQGVSLIALAGFLWLLPGYLVKEFSSKIVNIHPALLPKYGGKGMYGIHVHRAVRAANEIESGISIHFVNEAYDEGQLIFQASCSLKKDDSPEEIASKVLLLEHKHFAPTLEQLLEDRIRS